MCYLSGSLYCRINVLLHQTKAAWPYCMQAGRGGTYTCPFMNSSAWMGVHCFIFITGRKWGDLGAITCQSVKLSLLRQTKECGQPPPSPRLMGTDHLLHRMHWIAQHPWKHPPAYKIVQRVQWWVLPLKGILFPPLWTVAQIHSPSLILYTTDL